MNAAGRAIAMRSVAMGFEEPSDPEDRPQGRNGNGRYPGDDDRSQASHDGEGEEDPPMDGRQLLGLVAGQAHDVKCSVMSLVKRTGFPLGRTAR
jgi:hypothetical protein